MRWIGLAVGLAALLALGACGERAADPNLSGWRKEMGQIRIGANASEDSEAALARLKSYQAYITNSTGLPVKVFQAADYNGIIQAMASGQLEMATMGPAAYANARAQMGEKVAPILVPRTSEGSWGYYSTIVVRADSPYRTLADLRGKTVGYVDFNSASGYLYPRYALQRQGIKPDTYFGKSAITGGHTQGVLALQNGQFDAVFMVASGGTPATGFTTGSIHTLAQRGMLKLEDFRILWSAGPIPNSPYVIRTDRPQIFRDTLRGALASMAYDDPEIWHELGLGDGSDMKPMQPSDYKDIVAMRNAEVSSRRSNATGGGQ
ncbi:phosphate/phosphite/phosphonate ABC transporter substrate-binding protein [Sandarakinorhabdus sp.]|uniref:phosphate/phosphite/phosphonate ABC transporter substrate-binding protein n=1 Tax=Sandarakinorhabdus sp. TaxID=1916663 RepID=UPI00334280A1